MKKNIIQILLFILSLIFVNITLNLVGYYLFNESYTVPVESITSTKYSRLAYDNKNIEVFNIEFNEEDVLWMTQVLEEKEFKSLLFEKKGQLPMRQYIVAFKDDKDLIIHIFDDGKATIISSSTKWLNPNILVAYLSESEMTYLRSIKEK